MKMAFSPFEVAGKLYQFHSAIYYLLLFRLIIFKPLKDSLKMKISTERSRDVANFLFLRKSKRIVSPSRWGCNPTSLKVYFFPMKLYSFRLYLHIHGLGRSYTYASIPTSICIESG